jgi:hypothetical protein
MAVRLVHLERPAWVRWTHTDGTLSVLFKNHYVCALQWCLITGITYPVPYIVTWELQETGTLFEFSQVRVYRKCLAAHSCVGVASYGTWTFPQHTQKVVPYSGIILINILRPLMTRFLSLFHSFVSLLYFVLLCPIFFCHFYTLFVFLLLCLLFWVFLPLFSFLILRIFQRMSFRSVEWHVVYCGALKCNGRIGRWSCS